MYLLFLSVIALYILYTTGTAFLIKRKPKFLLAFIFALGMLILSLFPNLAHTITIKLGIGDNLNTLIFSGFVILFMFIVKLLKTTEQLKNQLSKFIEADAVRSVRNLKDEN